MPADKSRFGLCAEICLGIPGVQLGGGVSATPPRSFENSVDYGVSPYEPSHGRVHRAASPAGSGDDRTGGASEGGVPRAVGGQVVRVYAFYQGQRLMGVAL